MRPGTLRHRLWASWQAFKRWRARRRHRAWQKRIGYPVRRRET